MRFQFKIRPPECLQQNAVSRALAIITRETFPADPFEISEADSAWEDKIRVSATSPQVTISAYRYEDGDPLEWTIEIPDSAESDPAAAFHLLREEIFAALRGKLIP